MSGLDAGSLKGQLRVYFQDPPVEDLLQAYFHTLLPIYDGKLGDSFWGAYFNTA
jgi:hypothetical protein